MAESIPAAAMLAPYSESEEEEEGIAVPEATSKHRGAAVIFGEKVDYASEAGALAVIDSEGCWRKRNTSDTDDGLKVNFVCNAAKKRAEKQCPTRVYLLNNSLTLRWSIIRSEQGHDHEGLEMSKSLAISEEDQEIIQQLFRDGVRTPEAVKAALRARQILLPAKSQLEYFLKKVRHETFGPPQVSLGDLFDWCESRNELPSDTEMHTPFLMAKEISATGFEDSREDQVLRMAFTTRNLVQLAQKTSLLQTDTTYKVIWQGFPVFVFGASDANRVFHPFCMAVCSGETTEDFVFAFRALKETVEEVTGEPYEPRVLQADAASAISAAWQSVFGAGDGVKRCMCSFHSCKACKGRIESLPKEHRTISADISVLQASHSPEFFQAAYVLFSQKWAKHPPVKEFLRYFEANWVQKNSEWYEGAAIGFPSTNNGLESLNAAIKRIFTARNRMNVREFLGTMEERMLKGWSKDRDPVTGEKSFASSPSLTTPIWKEAVAWARLSKAVFPDRKYTAEDGRQFQVFYIASSTAPDLPTSSAVQRFKEMERTLGWDTWKSFMTEAFLFWRVRYCVSDWKASDCNCRIFLKRYVCKHSIGLCIRLKAPGLEIPLEARAVCVKRKRGRPSKAKRALIVQT